MSYSAGKLIDMLAHIFCFLFPGVDKHAHGQGVIVFKSIKIDVIGVPEGGAEDHQLGKMLWVDDTDISADQASHTAATYACIDPVRFGPVMGIHIWFKRFDDKIGVILPLPVSEFTMVVWAVFLDPFAAAVVDADHDQVPYACGGHFHQMAVNGPASKGSSIVKEVLGILEVKDRVIFIGIVIIMWKQGPDPSLFPKLGNLKIPVDQLDERVMRLSLSDL